MTSGTVYLLRNPSTDSGANGISFCQGGTNGTANISGGTLYCYLIRMHDGPGSGYTDWETFNVSGGDIYVGSGGVYDAGGGGTHHTAITLSGGTFHTLNLGPNTGGTQGTNSVLPDGADWAWAGTLPATLATSPGPGTVTFAPEATHTITLNAAFSGPGSLTVAGPGTVAMAALNTYTGNTTISQGTLALVGTGAIPNSPKIIVASGATLDASGLVLTPDPEFEPDLDQQQFDADAQRQHQHGPGSGFVALYAGHARVHGHRRGAGVGHQHRVQRQ